MNGAETRAELIDPLLAEAGWAVVEGSRIQRKFSIPPAGSTAAAAAASR
jgi:type I restriction enzyme R subunit